MRRLGIRGESKTDTAELVEQWLADLDLARMAAGYISQCRTKLADLPHFCPDIGRHDAHGCISRWWQHIRNREGLSPATMNSYLTFMRTFVNWCHDLKHIVGEKPSLGHRRVRESFRIKPQFSLADLRKILSMTDHRCWQACALAILGGLRRGEAFKLQADDIMTERRLIFVRAGKGDKDRYVMLQPQLMELFEEHPFKPYRINSEASYHRLWVSMLYRAGIEAEGRTFHSLRHAYAGLLTATGEPTMMVQMCMGHSQGDMTQRYSQYAAVYRADEGVASWPRGEIRL